MIKTVVQKFDDKNYKKQIAEVLEEDFLFEEKIKNIRSIFIKPNLVTDVPQYINNGANTDIRIIEAIISYLNNFPSLEIYLGESETGTKVKGRKLEYALKNMGILKMQKKYNFKIINLTEDEKEEITIPNGKILKKIKLSKTFLSSDLIINLPKIKTHKYATITCALKNMFGVIPDPLRIIYHQNIHQIIADLNKFFYSKIFTITDGIVCMEGQGPLYGKPRKLNLILFSNNPVANDYVVSQIMKISPQKIKHLQLANEWAKIDFSKIKISSFKKINEITRKPFVLANKNLFIKMEGFLMQFPFIVKIIFSDFFQKNISKKLDFLLKKLRGGSFSRYE